MPKKIKIGEVEEELLESSDLQDIRESIAGLQVTQEEIKKSLIKPSAVEVVESVKKDPKTVFQKFLAWMEA